MPCHDHQHRLQDELDRIRTPTLVMVGDQDVATVPATAERIASRIPGARLVVIPGAGHTATVEEPEAVKRELIAFLTDPRSPADDGERR